MVEAVVGNIEELDLGDLLGTVSAASRREESILTAPASVSVLQRAEIKASGASTIPDLLRRVPGVQVVQIAPYDLSDPAAPRFVTYFNNRDFGATNPTLAGDLGPEGVLFIKAEDSPDGNPLLVISNEISGTTTIAKIAKK